MSFNHNGTARQYDPVFASNAGLLSCPACDKAAPAKCEFHGWVDRKLDLWKRTGRIPLAKPLARGVYDGVLPLYDRQLFGIRWHCRVRGMFRV